MARAGYEDWNIDKKDENQKPLNSRVNSVIFLFTTIVLVITGIVNIYSVTFVQAIENGLSPNFYLMQYAMYIVAGLFVSVVIIVIPKIVLRFISFIIVLLCIFGLALNTMITNPITLSEPIFSIIFGATGCYLSSFFGKKGNRVNLLRILTMPILLGCATYTLILLNHSISFAMLYLAFLMVTFLICGARPKGVLLLLAYILVPTVLWSFSNTNNLNMLYRFFVNNTVSTSSQIRLRMQCIRSAGIFGNGIGLGQYKSMGIDDIAGSYIVCNIIDEAGYVGFLVVFILMCIFTCASYLYSSNSLRNDTIGSNIASVFTTLVFGQYLVNLMQVFNILPFEQISLPFYSYGINSAIVIMDAALIFKFMINKKKASEKLDDFNDEMIFAETHEKDRN